MKESWRWLLVVVIIVTIYFLSEIPNLHLINENQIPVWLKQLASKSTIRFGTTGYFSYIISLHPDYVLHKIGHIVVFGTLGVSFYWATSYSVTWAIALTAVTAAFDELHQYFVPGRSSRFGDVVIDTLAAVLFIVIVNMVKRRN